MEKIGAVVEKQTDSLKQKSQGKQTGSPECKKHGCHIFEYRDGYFCPECDEEEKKKREKAMKIAAAHRTLALPARLEGCHFDNYTPTNKKAEEAKRICMDFQGHNIGGGLIMVGGVGTGKTHLAAAICRKVCDNGQTAMMTTIPRIIREIRETWGKKATNDWSESKSERDIISKFSDSCRLLVIDEIGSQYGSESEKITVSEIIDNRYNNMLPTIIIGNITLSEAETYLGTRAVDRVKDGGTVIVFDWKSHRKLKV